MAYGKKKSYGKSDKKKMGKGYKDSESKRNPKPKSMTGYTKKV